MTEPDIRVVLLGTAGGPPLWPDTDRLGCSSAVVVGPHVYLVDLGEGWRVRYRQSGLALPRYPGATANVRAAFLTHLHSDHVVDYPNLALLAVTDGRRENPIEVLGPHGTEHLTDGIMNAFTADLHDRLRAGRNPRPEQVLRAADIPWPEGAGEAHPGRTPPAAPFTVYEDDVVSVSATLAAHPPMVPCYAFRFETEQGAIVFSGDTAPHDNIRELVRGARILVHEAVDAHWAQTALGGPGQKQILDHFLHSHTSAEAAAELAEEAGAGTLVLNHLVPANTTAARWRALAGAFGGELVVGADLDVVRL